MPAKTYTAIEYRQMKREYTQRLEGSDIALIKVLAIITRLRRLAIDGSIHGKIPEIIELCDMALNQPDRTPCEMPEED